MAEFINFFIYAGIFLDIGVGRRDISFGLIVVIVTHKVIYGVIGEKFFELTCQLGSKGLIMGNYERWTAELRNRICDSERLPGSRSPQQCLVLLALSYTHYQLIDRSRLISLWRIIGNKLEFLITDDNITHCPTSPLSSKIVFCTHLYLQTLC
ncbi:hypothetical protein D3C72_1112640 [compost metagenome]